LLALVALAPSPAVAQRRPVRPAAAAPGVQQLKDGEREEKRLDWGAALAAYQASFDAAPTDAALGGIARAHYALGHTVEAYEAYAKLEQRLREPELTKQKVVARLKELEGQTGTLAIQMSEPGAKLTLDGQDLGTTPVQVVRRVVAGKHVLRAVKEGAPPLDQPVEVPGGKNTIVDLRLPPPPKPDEPQQATTITVGPQQEEGDDEEGAGWKIPHGSKNYTAVRAKAAPKIDGVLDDAVWQQAPRDTRFLSMRSKPFGQPTREPTEVQVAFDEKNLYVAFRCGFGGKRPRDDSFPMDELAVLGEAESAGMLIDPLHNHSSAFAFVVSRSGVRADAEITDSGQNRNIDWRGIWDVAVTRGPDSWIAEFKIPWGTMRMPSREGKFNIGINFRRREAVTGEYSEWSLPPPATEAFDTNYFGHLEGLEDVHPGQRLYLQPYIAGGFDSDPNLTSLSPLYDFTTTVADSHVRAFAGLYARYQPPGPFRLDATFNPNFFGVNPDRALANFDRFEIEFPEARPFFAEDNPRFTFGGTRSELGDFGAQLYYSRRIGYQSDPTTALTRAVPILWGAKSVLRTSGGTDVSLMNVGLSSDSPNLELADNVSVGRFTQTLSGGSRVGAIVMGRVGSVDGYFTGGADGEMSLFDRHLKITGFYAGSWSNSKETACKAGGAGKGCGVSGAGQVTMSWASQDFYANATYTDIGTNFDAQLGYFPLTGIRGGLFGAGYTPVVRNDLVQQVAIEGQMTVVKDREDKRVYDRGIISAGIVGFDQSTFQLGLAPAIEDVASPFPIANGAIVIQQGSYKVMNAFATLRTNRRRTLFGTLGVELGDLFDGQRRAPFGSLGLNLGRFTTEAFYKLFFITYPGYQDVVGHQVSARASFYYTPLAKSILAIETNTVSARATAQLITSYTFGQLSELSLVLRATSGQNIALLVPAQNWYDYPTFVALLTFAFGFTPF
jgi:hypothetical protein